MNASEDETAGKDRPETAQAFMALPARTGDSRELFLECLADLVRAVGLDVPAEPDRDDRRGWQSQVRAALRNAGSEGLPASDAAFGALMKAAVHDPDPSFNRQFVEPALHAFGRRRVRSALLEYLRTGTDLERAGAARAWYWTALPLRLPNTRAENGLGESRTDSEDRSVLVRVWNEAALQEFVSNETWTFDAAFSLGCLCGRPRIRRNSTLSWKRRWRSLAPTRMSTSATAWRSKCAVNRGRTLPGLAARPGAPCSSVGGVCCAEL